MKKGLFLVALLVGLGTGLVIYYILKSKAINDADAKKTPDFDPNADVNIYRVNSAINYQNTPPTQQPVSAYAPNYRELIENECIQIAQNSTRVRAVQQAANIPTEAYNTLQGDNVLSDQVKRVFVQRFNINPSVAAEYPFASKYLSQSFKTDLQAIVANISALKNAITQQGNITKAGRVSTFNKFIKLTPQAFYVRFWLLDFRSLILEVIANTENYAQDTAKVNLLSNFFSDLANVQIERLNSRIYSQAITDLKARGYKFIEFP